ncbi:ATP-binding protein [Tautonia rosea]|uniref:ATP-binding protein n=1 Tax=Tautonia rosea TaxID=2728037 RepID=UPI001472C480|nr:ATP-binding protein [Tautonia rosea]
MNASGVIARNPILDALCDAIIVIDQNERIVFANRSAEQTTGRPQGSLTRMFLRELLSWSDGSQQSHSLEISVREQSFCFQATLARPDGTNLKLDCEIGSTFREADNDLTVMTLRPSVESAKGQGRAALLDYLRMTTRLTDRLGSRPSLELVLSTAIDTLIQDFGAAIARVWLMDPVSQEYRLAASGVPGDSVEIDPESIDTTSELPPEIIEVARSGMHFLVEDLQADQRFDRDWIARHRLGSLIALPLSVAGERHGILVAAMRSEPSDECLDALLGFSSIISASLNDVQLLFGELSARVDAEAEHRRFQSIVDLIPIGVVLVTGPNPRVTLINPACREMLGKDDLAPMSLQQYSRLFPVQTLDGSPIAEFNRPLWRAFYRAEEVRETIRYIRPDGVERIFEVIAHPFPTIDGGAIATYHDMTERSELQSDLAMRAAQLKALLDHLPVGVAYFDLDCQCRACNGPAWRILGRSRSQIIGASAAELFADSPDLLSAVRRCVADLEPHVQINAPWTESAGGESIRYLEWRFEPLLTSNREPIGALALIGDVTARKRTADAMQKAKDDAERSARNKSRFLSAISHDLRTPVNALNLLAETLARRLGELPQDDELNQLSSYLKRASGNLAELVNDLLDLTCFDSGVINQYQVEFPIEEWLDSTLGPMQLAAEEKHLAFSWDFEGTTRWVRADRVKLGRVLSNLVGNAIKFTETGYIRVLVSLPPDGRLQFSVEDSGPGIPETQLGQIFDEFAQLRNPERDRSKGTGLGLAICRRLVEAVGGRMEVSSNSGSGSRFVSVFPVTPLPCPPGSFASSDQHPLAEKDLGDRPRVLLVEDDETTRLPMSHLLELSGFDVMTACDGPEALELLARERPTMVLLDLMMPRMDGIEVLQRIRGDDHLANLPVLILSGDVLDERSQQLQALGVSGTLAKPIDFDRLLAVLEDLLVQST